MLSPNNAAAAAMAVALLLATPLAAESAPGPTAVVVAFNNAISAGNADGAIQHLSTGGVQFTLRSMHDGIGPEQLTTPLAAHWSMILPVILGSTERYTRTIEVLSAEAHGDIATVWAQATTVSQRRGKPEAQTSVFTEIYMLMATPDGWKIASLADNRAASSL